MSGLAALSRSRGWVLHMPLSYSAVATPFAAERCPSPKDAVRTAACAWVLGGFSNLLVVGSLGLIGFWRDVFFEHDGID